MIEGMPGVCCSAKTLPAFLPLEEKVRRSKTLAMDLNLDDRYKTLTHVGLCGKIDLNLHIQTGPDSQHQRRLQLLLMDKPAPGRGQSWGECVVDKFDLNIVKCWIEPYRSPWYSLDRLPEVEFQTEDGRAAIMSGEMENQVGLGTYFPKALARLKKYRRRGYLWSGTNLEDGTPYIVEDEFYGYVAADLTAELTYSMLREVFEPNTVGMFDNVIPLIKEYSKYRPSKRAWAYMHMSGHI